MTSIVLQRLLKVQCWHVVGQIAQAGKRSELMPVLLRARENGTTEVADIAEHLLFESSSRRVVAQRLLHITQRLGLTALQGEQYILTTSGQQALETGRMFLPEAGAWTIWACPDPLLSTSVLRFEAWREPLARHEANRKRNEASRQSEPLPEWLMDEKGSELSPPAQAGVALRIDQLERNGEPIDPQAKLWVTWNVSAGSMRLKGEVAGKEVDTALDPPPIAAAAVWCELLERECLWPLWDESVQALRVTFGTTTPEERQSMRRQIEFRRPLIKTVGEFLDMTIKDVPLLAATAEDADGWATWRLKETIRDYATAEKFAAWSSDASTPFEEFRTLVTNRKRLIDKIYGPPGDEPHSTLIWHLMAAEDWDL